MFSSLEKFRFVCGNGYKNKFIMIIVSQYTYNKSFCCTTKVNTMLYVNYISNKFFLKIGISNDEKF